MSTDPLDFLDSDSSDSSDPLSFLGQEKTSKFKKSARLAAQYAIGNAERLAAPYDIAVSPLSSKKAQQVPYRENLFSDIERLQEQKQMGKWDKQDQELYDSLIEQVKDPEKAEKFIKTTDISSAGLIEKGSKKLGYDISPEGIEEHGARIAGNLLSPKNLYKGAKYGKSLLNKEARATIKEKSQWKSLERSTKGNSAKENILNFSRQHDLNPNETTLLLQSDAKIDFLEKLSKKSKKFKETALSLKNKLGKSYEDLKRLGKEGGHLNVQEADVLENDLYKILDDMNKTFIEGPDTKGARIAIEEAIHKIGNKGGTVEDLINSTQNLKQVVNWRKVDAKGAYLKRAEDAFYKAIESKNPEIAKRLKFTNDSYKKYKKFAKLLDKKQPIVSIQGLQLPDFMGNLAFGAALKFIGGASLIGSVKGVAIKEVVQRLSTKLLTDPKYQGIHKHIVRAVQEGATKKQKELLTVLKSMIKKDDPDLYDEISDISVE